VISKIKEFLKKMRFGDFTFIVFVVVVFFGIAIVNVGKHFNILDDDSFIEESIEEIIEDETGISIDLTPNSDEDGEDLESEDEYLHSERVRNFLQRFSDSLDD